MTIIFLVVWLAQRGNVKCSFQVGTREAAQYVRRIIQALTCTNCCSERKPLSITYSESVCV